MNEETNTDLIAQPQKDAMKTLSERMTLISRLMKDHMKEKEDWGHIPGCAKPCLFQPGAEKLGVLFGVIAEPVDLEDLSSGDEVRFRAKMEARNENGSFMGSVYGECSSFEEKYKWRKAVCDDEWNDALETRRRIKYGKGKGGSSYKIKQVLRDPEDARNTIILMAQKRAFVAVMRRVTGASNIFTQEGDTGDNDADTPDNDPPPEQTTNGNGFISDSQISSLEGQIADFDITDAERKTILFRLDIPTVGQCPKEKYTQLAKAIGELGAKKQSANA